jgi:hypothetical protein
MGGEIMGELQGLGLFGDVTFGPNEIQRVGHGSNNPVPTVVTTTTLAPIRTPTPGRNANPTPGWMDQFFAIP